MIFLIHCSINSSTIPIRSSCNSGQIPFTPFSSLASSSSISFISFRTFVVQIFSTGTHPPFARNASEYLSLRMSGFLLYQQDHHFVSACSHVIFKIVSEKITFRCRQLACKSENCSFLLRFLILILFSGVCNSVFITAL